MVTSQRLVKPARVQGMVYNNATHAYTFITPTFRHTGLVAQGQLHLEQLLFWSMARKPTTRRYSNHDSPRHQDALLASAWAYSHRVFPTL